VKPEATSKESNSYGSNDTSYGMHSATIAETFTTPNVNDRPISHHQVAPLPFALGQSIYGSSPFSPQPGELQAPLSDHPMTAMRLSNLKLSNRKQQYAAASALEQKTGQNLSRHSAWGTMASVSGTPSPQQQQIIGQILHSSLAEQYPPSSMFSNNSSVYAGTPYGGRQPNLHYGGAIPRGIDINESTNYGSMNHDTLLQSSLWNGSRPASYGPIPTPPGGQGG